MSDTPAEDPDFGKELAAAFATDEEVVENPAAPGAENANKPEPGAPANTEEPKKNEPEKPEPNKEENTETPPTDPAKKPEEGDTPPEGTETPPTPEEPKPLTEDSIRRIMNDVRAEERNSGQELQNTTQDVMEAYYPEGLSNVLVDQNSGKQLHTPQDVVDASGGEMGMEEATQWLMNEQYKLDQSIAGIKEQATQIAETTVNFKRDAVAALQKYEPLFTAYPHLQEKAYNLMMRQVKADTEKGVILQAPDVMELYDDYLEPYQKAYEFSTQQPATNPTPDPNNPPAPTPAPGINDRLDEGGDGGANTEVDDPNDFAQQVNKELAKGM